jgi:PEP-CTERM motif
VSHFGRLWFLRVALVIVVCFSAVSLVQADNIGTLYTGSFSVSTDGSAVWQPWAFQVGGTLLGNTQTLEYSVTFYGPISNFEVTPPCGSDCPQFFSGDLNSGTISFSGVDYLDQHPYNFAGYLTPGGSIVGDVVCDSYGCTWNESVFVSFVGQPSNGWQSVGNIILDGGNAGWGGGDSGLLNLVTTPTPEPSSIALLSTGIVGFAAAWRRKLKR